MESGVLYPEIEFPVSVKSVTLLDILKEQKASKYSGEIYHKTQIDLTYNSNHIEGSRLTHDQTRYIFETNTIGVEKEVLNVDDVIETANHFCCIDMIIDHAKAALTEKFIKELHLVLKNGTSDSRKDWYRIFEKILSEKNIDAFNGAQGRILYVLWQEDGISIRDRKSTRLNSSHT